MNSSERFKLILKKINDTHDKKQADYGTSEDPFANISASIDLGIEPWVGTILRMNDKMARIKSFIKNGTLKNERIEDSLLDICVYAAIALVKYEESVGDKNKHDCECGHSLSVHSSKNKFGFSYCLVDRCLKTCQL